VLGPVPGPARAVVVFVLSDLCNYLGHRLLHRVGWLWRWHAVHHSSRRLDWLATSRGHPVDQVLNLLAAALPVLVLGGASYASALIGFLYLYPFLLHANVRLPSGRLGLILVTPEFHHWHHAADLEAHDRNFGAVLSLWDRLFATAHTGRGRPTAYGIDDPTLDGRDYLGQLAAPLGRRAGRGPGVGVAQPGGSGDPPTPDGPSTTADSLELAPVPPSPR
jgi:sterol desaturase/sphingolipid hydroxylase (fatty acid hydroxylase superfamily)